MAWWSNWLPGQEADLRFASAPLNRTLPEPDQRGGRFLDPWTVGVPDPWTTSTAAATSPRFSASGKPVAAAVKGGPGGAAGAVARKAGGIGAALRGPWGVALAGVPIAMGAISELNNPAGDTVGNLSGAVGSIGGGIGGAALGAALGTLAGPLAPVAMPLGAWAGSALGGPAARGISDLIRNNDPLGKEIKAAERMADSQFYTQLRHREAALPMQRIQAELGMQMLARQRMNDARMNALLNYQNGMLQAGFAQAPQVDITPAAAILQSALA